MLGVSNPGCACVSGPPCRRRNGLLPPVPTQPFLRQVWIRVKTNQISDTDNININFLSMDLSIFIFGLDTINTWTASDSGRIQSEYYPVNIRIFGSDTDTRNLGTRFFCIII